MTSRVFGVIPARMAASRFPGKPLAEISGKSMVRHVADTANKYKFWHSLTIATCDQEIIDHIDGDFKTVMTSEKHVRALDRVAEAYQKLCSDPREDDIVICVQGDEPMMNINMIESTIKPLQESKEVKATVLAMPIIDEIIWKNPDTVKLIFNEKGKVLYTSRSPVPYSKKAFDRSLGAHRIVGIFGFEWSALKEFTFAKESRLENIEACDSNRIFELSFDQYIAPIDYQECFSVDSPEDIHLVEESLRQQKNDAE